MRYRLEFHRNPDCLSIHVDKKVTDEIIKMFEGQDHDKEVQSKLVKDIFGIDGVCKVTVTAYEISLVKGSVFDWEEMVSAILQLVQMNLDPNGELVEKKPPTKTCINGRGFAYEEPYDPQKPDQHLTEPKGADENDMLGGYGDE